MAAENAKRDGNNVPVALGVTDDANLETRMLRADPTSKRLKVSAIITGGGGGISGPVSSTDNALVRWNGTGGSAVQNSGVILSDTDGMTFPINSQIFVSTDKQTNTAVGLIRLNFTTNEAKAIIAYVDENGQEVIWLQAHNYLLFPSNQHKHFSIEASDAAGLKQTRLGVGYGADNVAVTVNQADLTINRNSGISPPNGNVIMTGSGGGGVFQHDNAFQFYPLRGTNSSIALNVSLANTDELTLNVIGGTLLYLNDGLMINTASGGDYASLVRFGGEGASNYQGGYIQYDAAGNEFIIGTHNTADELNASDVEVIRIARSGLAMTITAPTTFTIPTQTTDIKVIDSSITWNASGVAFTAWKLNVTNTASAATAKLLDLQVGGTPLFSVDKTGKVIEDTTITSPGTTGAQTINKPTGRVNFAATATTLVVTNSLVSADSFVFAVVQSNDATSGIKNVIPTAGSFTITLTSAATAETPVGFWVIN